MPTQTINFAPLIDAIRVSPGLAPPPPPVSALVTNRNRLRGLLARLAALRCEGLILYKPLPKAAEFHACREKFCIVEGSNRSSKSLTCCVELARALLGCDPYDKYPKRNGSALLLGLKEDNIAMLWRKLAHPGEFQIIRDEITNEWRAVRPDPDDPRHLDPYDLAYCEKWKDAPPLLPPRLVNKDNISWDNASREVPRTVIVPSTGWRLECRPSGARPDQGDHLDFALADEEMEKREWYNEIVRGLTGLGKDTFRTPRFLWSATSQVASPEFGAMRENAMQHVPGYARFSFIVDDNAYVPDAEKLFLYNSYLTEEDRQTRYYGVPAVSFRYVYGTYSAEVHGCEPFEIPPDWCRYAIVDPGTQACATLLMAVDPDEEHAWIYEGWVMRNAEQTAWAYQLQERERGVQFESIIMDERAGKQHAFAASKNTAQQFWLAAEQIDLRPRTFGPMNGFFPGTPDVKARTIALRNWLTIRPDGPFAGTPILQIMRGVCPELDKQIKGAISDRRDPEKRQKFDNQPCDLLDDLEYAAGFGPRYYSPSTTDTQSVSFAVHDFENHWGSQRNLRRATSAVG